MMHIEINYIFFGVDVVCMDETIGIMYIMIIFNAPQRQSSARRNANKFSSSFESFNSDHAFMLHSSASYDCVSFDYFRILRCARHGQRQNSFLFDSLPFFGLFFCFCFGQKRADRLSAVVKL